MKQRLSLQIQGLVQGVGFRPFVYCLATELKLTGWVNNSAQGVEIEVEGEKAQLEIFILRLQSELPPLSKIQELKTSWLTTFGYQEFRIKSSTAGKKTALILPDTATCDHCRREIFDSQNRRYLYPFTNCTNCGSRFTIIEALPYDRPNTTMKDFTMCDRCLAEYQNPRDRRFHAQPNACRDCGPYLELWDSQGNILTSHHDALLTTAAAIREGKIVALKGLGGFQLIVDASNSAAIQKLRDRKQRPDKPFALMYPNLELVTAHCQVAELEAKLLLSPEAPIVLLKKRINSYQLVAPNNPYLGVMLPYTPLHHILIKELDFPIVATSGNLSGEPICIDNREALQKLNKIADIFLVHNRPIARPVDDSIVRVIAGREQILRRARGYVPLPITIPRLWEKQEGKLTSMLAVGGQLKNTTAFLNQGRVFLSQYIGDLESAATYKRHQQTISDFQQLYELEPLQVSCDLHPHYLSTQYAQKLNLPLTTVQHHYAHVLSCLADNEIETTESVLGIAWDGTGYGLDGTIWGGEFLAITNRGFERVAHLKTFRLPGGEKAIKEPRRIAISLLCEIFGDRLFVNSHNFNDLPCMTTFSNQELNLLGTILNKKINAPITSSMGRLFDGIASILGIRQQITYEGQGAMELESAIADLHTNEVYSFELIKQAAQNTNSPIVVDWTKMILEILTEIRQGRSIAEIAAKFHNTLVEMIVAIAKIIKRKQIVLTGGCFQNKYLAERAISRLRQEDFIPYWHHRIPCNDGGIAVGQIMTNSICNQTSNQSKMA